MKSFDEFLNEELSDKMREKVIEYLNVLTKLKWEKIYDGQKFILAADVGSDRTKADKLFRFLNDNRINAAMAGIQASVDSNDMYYRLQIDTEKVRNITRTDKYKKFLGDNRGFIQGKKFGI